LTGICAEVLRVEVGHIDPETELADYGMDSIMMMRIIAKIEAAWGAALEPNALVQHPSIRGLAGYLMSEGIVAAPMAAAEGGAAAPARVPPASLPQAPARLQPSAPAGGDIAVIGMACRFPGGSTIEEFWHLLSEGRSAISEVPPLRWEIDAYYSPDRNAPAKSYSKWAGFVEGIEFFDAAFFGIADDDARIMDPQQRMLLELAQELFERAGYNDSELKGTSTGVFLGAGESPYVRDRMELISPSAMKHFIAGKIQNMMAARISDFYDLRGESQTIDTACSSALVAIHRACQSIRAGECDCAVAGGAELILGPYYHIGFCKGGALSPEERSYVFDERANGFVLGEGAGLVLLKPDHAAVRDGDRIAGIIAGSAVNNDGHTIGVTMPSLDGQKEVIRHALRASGVSPADISLYEAHGTGTLLGDPIEVKAATEVYREHTSDLRYCGIGSVKSNVGHLLHAAGVASLIKVLLAMQHEQLPPTLNCQKPHPRFRFGESPFFPIGELQPWAARNRERCAALSSFGFGGTNCHMIVKQAPLQTPRRQPLARTQFDRKRFWLEAETSLRGARDAGIFDERACRELLEQLRTRRLSPQHAMAAGSRIG
jgi:acyl transferase domain-containing protein/acyl carrier protein